MTTDLHKLTTDVVNDQSVIFEIMHYTGDSVTFYNK